MATRGGYKGSAEAVAAAFAVIIISSIVIYTVYTTMLLQPRSELPSAIVEYSGEKAILFLSTENETGLLTLCIKNIGSTVIKIEHVVAVNTYNLTKLVVDVNKGSTCRLSSHTLYPGQMAVITCTEEYIPVAIITRSGRVHAIDARVHTIYLGRLVGVPMTTVLGETMVTSTSDLINYVETPSLLITGAVNTTAGFDRIYERSNASINGRINATLIIVGANPMVNKTNVLIVGYGLAHVGSYLEIRSSGETIRINVSIDGRFRFRIKMENFIGSINASYGISACQVNFNSTCLISIDGTADRVVFYGSSTNASSVVGLDPFVFVGDIDSNGNVDVIFVTQDFNVSNVAGVNDVLRIGATLLTALDSSHQPLRLVFTHLPIDGAKYSAAVVSVRMFFWDNSLDDITDNDNRIIVRVGLYNPETRSFVYSTELAYYELNRFRHVRPFSVSYIVKDFLVYIPQSSANYYIAVEIVDPFHVEGTRNDADLVIGLEYIGIVLTSR